MKSDDVTKEYLRLLQQLVSIRSVFSDDRCSKEISSFCLGYLKECVPAWNVFQDKAGNVIAFNPKVDENSNRIFLSAHLDTVDASHELWRTSGNPFEALLTDEYVVGRGVNDCKAGVAFALLVTYLFSCGHTFLSNVVIVLSFREEGNLWKTCSYAASRIGRNIPCGRSNVIVCLENTTSVSLNAERCVPSVAAYDCEPSNYFVNVRGKLDDLYALMLRSAKLTPVYISNVQYKRLDTVAKIVSGEGGHSARVPRTENSIFKAIQNSMRSSSSIESVGSRDQLSTIPSKVEVRDCGDAPEHELTLNVRDFITEIELKKLFQDWQYTERVPIRLAFGSDRRFHRPTQRVLEIARTRAVNLNFDVMPNPGRSDASAYWKHMKPLVREKTGVIVMGPGTRSHVGNDKIRRNTHGPDEAFHIPSGMASMYYLLEVVSQLNSDL